MNLAEGIDADHGLATEGDVTAGAAEADSSAVFDRSSLETLDRDDVVVVVDVGNAPALRQHDAERTFRAVKPF